eukprot:1688427-Pleurochrysis_carterae.AAC.3
MLTTVWATPACPKRRHGGSHRPLPGPRPDEHGRIQCRGGEHGALGCLLHEHIKTPMSCLLASNHSVIYQFCMHHSSLVSVLHLVFYGI